MVAVFEPLEQETAMSVAELRTTGSKVNVRECSADVDQREARGQVVASSA